MCPLQQQKKPPESGGTKRDTITKPAGSDFRRLRCLLQSNGTRIKRVRLIEPDLIHFDPSSQFNPSSISKNKFLKCASEAAPLYIFSAAFLTMTLMRTVINQKKAVFFIALGVCLVALAITLNIGWIVLNWREVALMVFGVIFFGVIIAGLVLNTIFLVREIRRNEQHDSFINAVTHELKTPLASIRLYLETLKSREVDEARRREFYDIMLADSDRLLHTVEQVLRASQSGQRRRRTPQLKVDLAELVSECLALARTRYHLGADKLKFRDSPGGSGPVTVLGDPEELRAAVSNLIDNAIKYSGDDVDVSVEVAEVDDRRVAVRVSDRGIGIPHDQLKRIFKRFYRVPAPVLARIKGTGLGLFIVRSIVERHGGRVFADSAGEGRGSTFTVQLPKG
jgi:signal transduction histidine kinase